MSDEKPHADAAQLTDGVRGAHGARTGRAHRCLQGPNMCRYNVSVAHVHPHEIDHGTVHTADRCGRLRRRSPIFNPTVALYPAFKTTTIYNTHEE